METAAISVVLLTGMVGLLAAALSWAGRRYASDADKLVDTIETLLPQTQCGQCGYPGCRPYASAVASGAALNLCPPGGTDTQIALSSLLDRDAGPSVEPAVPVIARIDESACIGCYLCVEACPVDAIVGARKFMHTIIEKRCTGCELCLPPCPVDCIELLPVMMVEVTPAPPSGAACIRCNRCEPVCPEGLSPQTLWWLGRGENLAPAREQGLDACIECGLCNAECPAGIDLLAVFRNARSRLAALDAARQRALRAGQLVAERSTRLAFAAERSATRRERRLADLKGSQHGDDP